MNNSIDAHGTRTLINLNVFPDTRDSAEKDVFCSVF